MITSVMLTGDAGGLNYIDDVLIENPKSALKACCGSDNTVKAEYSFAKPVVNNNPVKKNNLKKQAPL